MNQRFFKCVFKILCNKEHIEYVRNHIGVDYIGIGADYDGVPLTPVGAEDVSKYPNVFAELIDRGWTEEDLAKIAGGNIIRVFKEVEKVTLNFIFILFLFY